MGSVRQKVRKPRRSTVRRVGVCVRVGVFVRVRVCLHASTGCVAGRLVHSSSIFLACLLVISQVFLTNPSFRLSV